MPYHTYPYELPPLPYAYSAMEPYIDEETMRLHHDKHFKTYIDNLNAALSGAPDLQRLSLAQLLSWPFIIPSGIREKVMQNAGGVYNHMLFFEMLSPPDEEDHLPKGRLLLDIEKTFGSFDAFKKKFSDAAKAVFGSGWVALARDRRNALVIVTLPNQETVRSAHMQPILLFDVWEHAYYLKYKNVRADYVDALWNIISFPPR